MDLSQLILTANNAGTLAIGTLTFFIVYTTFRGIEDREIQEFSKRFMMAIAVLLLYVSYLMTYETFFPDSIMARYPMYLMLVVVFGYLIYAVVAFERVAEKYGISEETKLDKMEEKEGV